LNLLEVCKIPFQKEKASDELHQVPFLPTFFNSLCEYLKFEYVVPEDREPTEEELGLMEEFEVIKQEVAKVVAAIASDGVQEIKDKEATLEDKMMYGSETSALQRLYSNGNRNLVGISKSNMPETLVNILANNPQNVETVITVTEAIAHSALFCKSAELLTSMGVMKDLLRIIAETDDFRSYLVHIAIEAVWNLIEVQGIGAIESIADQ